MLQQLRDCIEIIDAICLSWYSVQLLEVIICAEQNELGILPGPNCQLSPDVCRIMSDCGVGLRLTCVDSTPDFYRLPLPCGGYFAQEEDYSGWNHITRASLQVTGMSYRLVG